jgi:hypothetical protein
MTQKVFFCILIIGSFVNCGLNHSQGRRGPLQKLNLNEPILERWLAGALFVHEDQFVTVDAHPDLLFRPLQESKGALGFFLKEEVDPFRGVQAVHWKAHAAEPGGIDLLKCKYEAAGLQLVIIEGRNLVFVNAARTNESLAHSKSKRDYVADLLEIVVQTRMTDHHWEFQLPADLEQSWNQRLISNNGARPIKDLQSRHDRADILLLNDSVYFIFYKKIDQLEDFLPDDKWFSPEARAALKNAPKNP